MKKIKELDYFQPLTIRITGVNLQNKSFPVKAFAGIEITGMKTQSKLWIILYPPLCGIVQLTNSAALCFQNWSFTIYEPNKN